eukprot:TRINITY_DN1578_c0_g1_i2.p1 TRINITY_DN1578_c0_g1~~TRINITY_DN1578_c0_g1_i2.p1  ORF type:complete len:147 (-),score=13.73 TRINITY_DN1578_c0_g1_i2:77-517(-)
MGKTSAEVAGDHLASASNVANVRARELALARLRKCTRARTRARARVRKMCVSSGIALAEADLNFEARLEHTNKAVKHVYVERNQPARKQGAHHSKTQLIQMLASGARGRDSNSIKDTWMARGFRAARKRAETHRSNRGFQIGRAHV